MNTINTNNAMTKMFGALLVIGLFFNGCFYDPCDDTDYSDLIRELAVPIEQSLEEIYQTTNRLPTIVERNIAIEQAGCILNATVVSKDNLGDYYYCRYKNKEFRINPWQRELTSGKEYEVEIRHKRSDCSLEIDGEIGNVFCGGASSCSPGWSA